MQQFLSRQFLLFLLTGGTAAVINFNSRIILNTWMSFSDAVILAYLIGMTVAFILAKCFVFTESQQTIHRSVAFFIIVNVAAVLQTWVISISLAYYLLPWLGVTLFVREIAHLVGISVPIITSYIGHKRWSFR